MSPFLAELFGTALLILLGDGVVANVVLGETRGHNSGGIVTTNMNRPRSIASST